MKKLDEILKNERIWGHEIMFPLHSAWVKLPDCGRCSVIWSDCEDGMEHVSVSPKKQFRIDVAECREITVADKEMYIESNTFCDWISFDEIGKTVFLTEAEAKLKELEESHDGK